MILHNLLRQRHPGIAAQEADHEAENHNVIPGAWRDRQYGRARCESTYCTSELSCSRCKASEGTPEGLLQLTTREGRRESVNIWVRELVTDRKRPWKSVTSHIYSHLLSSTCIILYLLMSHLCQVVSNMVPHRASQIVADCNKPQQSMVFVFFQGWPGSPRLGSTIRCDMFALYYHPIRSEAMICWSQMSF